MTRNVAAPSGNRLTIAIGFAGTAVILALLSVLLIRMATGGEEQHPPPASALIARFERRYDGKYGYRMLVPIGWSPVDLGGSQGYVPPGSTGRRDRVLLSVTPLEIEDPVGEGGFPLGTVEGGPSAEEVAEAYQSRLLGPTFEKERSLPDAEIYSATSSGDAVAPDRVRMIAYAVRDGRAFAVSLEGFGSYSSVGRLHQVGLLSDLETMVSSLDAR